MADDPPPQKIPLIFYRTEGGKRAGAGVAEGIAG